MPSGPITASPWDRRPDGRAEACAVIGRDGLHFSGVARGGFGVLPQGDTFVIEQPTGVAEVLISRGDAGR